MNDLQISARVFSFWRAHQDRYNSPAQESNGYFASISVMLLLYFSNFKCPGIIRLFILCLTYCFFSFQAEPVRVVMTPGNIIYPQNVTYLSTIPITCWPCQRYNKTNIHSMPFLCSKPCSHRVFIKDTSSKVRSACSVYLDTSGVMNLPVEVCGI